MRKRKKITTEKDAIEYHKKVHGGVHTFYIGSYEEYCEMRPFLLMFKNTKIVSRRSVHLEYEEKWKKENGWQEREDLLEDKKKYSRKGFLYSSIKIGSHRTNKALRNHKITIYHKGNR